MPEIFRQSVKFLNFVYSFYAYVLSYKFRETLQNISPDFDRRRKRDTCTHSSNGIGTHDSNVPAGEDTSCIRQRVRCDRQGNYAPYKYPCCEWWSAKNGGMKWSLPILNVIPEFMLKDWEETRTFSEDKPLGWESDARPPRYEVIRLISQVYVGSRKSAILIIKAKILPIFIYYFMNEENWPQFSPDKLIWITSPLYSPLPVAINTGERTLLTVKVTLSHWTFFPSWRYEWIPLISFSPQGIISLPVRRGLPRLSVTLHARVAVCFLRN